MNETKISLPAGREIFCKKDRGSFLSAAAMVQVSL